LQSHGSFRTTDPTGNEMHWLRRRQFFPSWAEVAGCQRHDDHRHDGDSADRLDHRQHAEPDLRLPYARLRRWWRHDHQAHEQQYEENLTPDEGKHDERQ
jgi:hypothetical protein